MCWGEIVISAPEPKMYEVDSEGDFSNCGAERAIRHSRGILTGPERSRQPSARDTRRRRWRGASEVQRRVVFSGRMRRRRRRRRKEKQKGRKVQEREGKIMERH